MKMCLSSIPRDTTVSTEERLLTLRNRDLREQDLQELWYWLQETDFAADPSRAWVGELAAKMLKEQGTTLKPSIRSSCESAEGWLLYFWLIILLDEVNGGGFRDAVARAAKSPEVMIRAFAEELIWSLQVAEKAKLAAS